MRNPFALAAILGGTLWIALHIALTGAWERGDIFPTYEFLNALRPLPLALFALALYGVYRVVNTGSTAFRISLAGFFLLAVGAATEFWIGGGVRDGDVDTLSLAGWLTYLLGFFVLSVGLVGFGITVYRARAWGTFGTLPLLAGIVWAAWFPLILLGNLGLADYGEITQYVFAILWIAMGVLMSKGDPARLAISET